MSFKIICLIFFSLKFKLEMLCVDRVTEFIQKLMFVIPPEAHSIDDVDHKHVTSYLKENKVLQRGNTLVESGSTEKGSEKEVNYQTFYPGDHSNSNAES